MSFLHCPPSILLCSLSFFRVFHLPSSFPTFLHCSCPLSSPSHSVAISSAPNLLLPLTFEFRRDIWDWSLCVPYQCHPMTLLTTCQHLFSTQWPHFQFLKTQTHIRKTQTECYILVLLIGRISFSLHMFWFPFSICKGTSGHVCITVGVCHVLLIYPCWSLSCV